MTDRLVAENACLFNLSTRDGQINASWSLWAQSLDAPSGAVARALIEEAISILIEGGLTVEDIGSTAEEFVRIGFKQIREEKDPDRFWDLYTNFPEFMASIPSLRTEQRRAA